MTTRKKKVDILGTRTKFQAQREMLVNALSYHSTFNVLSEAVQNAIDAIYNTAGNKGNLQIEICCGIGTIKVRDDGTGMSRDVLERHISPGWSTKQVDGEDHGKLGYGSAHVASMSNEITIKSRQRQSSGGTLYGNIKNMREWILDYKNKKKVEMPLFEVWEDKKDNRFRGTEITISLPLDHPIFKYSGDEI